MSQHKIFLFDKLKIYFKHTDFYGFVHPYNYLEWTSYVREAFFSEICPGFESILNSPIKMMTAKINCVMHADSTFGDEIEARFSTAKIKKVSFDVIVRFLNTRLSKIVCETQHTLVFVDSETNQFTEIPKALKDSVLAYDELGHS